MSNYHCTECGQEIPYSDSVPNYCVVECGSELVDRVKAGISNEILSAWIRSGVDTSHYGVSNRVQAVYSKIEDMDTVGFYSDSLGVIKKPEFMKSFKEIGLAVEKNRGQYELERTPKRSTIDAAVAVVPRSCDLRKLVHKVAMEESKASSTFITRGGDTIDKDMRGWPMESLSVPQPEGSEDSSSEESPSVRDFQESESEDVKEDDGGYSSESSVPAENSLKVERALRNCDSLEQAYNRVDQVIKQDGVKELRSSSGTVGAEQVKKCIVQLGLCMDMLSRRGNGMGSAYEEAPKDRIAKPLMLVSSWKGNGMDRSIREHLRKIYRSEESDIITGANSAFGQPKMEDDNYRNYWSSRDMMNGDVYKHIRDMK